MAEIKKFPPDWYKQFRTPEERYLDEKHAEHLAEDHQCGKDCLFFEGEFGE